MKCRTCGWSNGEHDPGCPKTQGQQHLYHLGWKDGRAGIEAIQNDDFYMLGYNNGVAAREECDNGHDPRAD